MRDINWSKKCKEAATKWMQEEQEVHLHLSVLDPTHANNLLEGFGTGWKASEEQLFKDILEETGHITLASLIDEWKVLKEANK